MSCPTLGWSCAAHGDSLASPCGRCGGFFCAACVTGLLCTRCSADQLARASFEGRLRGLRWTTSAPLFTAALFFAVPPLLADALAVRGGDPSNRAMSLFAALFAGPPLIGAFLVLILRWPWAAWLALPTALLAAVNSALLGGALAPPFLLGVGLVACALVRSIQWWRHARRAAPPLHGSG